jgi:hypothetical protein
MQLQPSLFLARLILRPFSMEDALSVQRLAGEFAIGTNQTLLKRLYGWRSSLMERCVIVALNIWLIGSIITTRTKR